MKDITQDVGLTASVDVVVTIKRSQGCKMDVVAKLIVKWGGVRRSCGVEGEWH